jgi:hypothetical protein
MGYSGLFLKYVPFAGESRSTAGVTGCLTGLILQKMSGVRLQGTGTANTTPCALSAGG